MRTSMQAIAAVLMLGIVVASMGCGRSRSDRPPLTEADVRARLPGTWVIHDNHWYARMDLWYRFDADGQWSFVVGGTAFGIAMPPDRMGRGDGAWTASAATVTTTVAHCSDPTLLKPGDVLTQTIVELTDGFLILMDGDGSELHAERITPSEWPAAPATDASR
jgi:hypothetical protein